MLRVSIQPALLSLCAYVDSEFWPLSDCWRDTAVHGVWLRSFVQRPYWRGIARQTVGPWYMIADDCASLASRAAVLRFYKEQGESLVLGAEHGDSRTLRVTAADRRIKLRDSSLKPDLRSRRSFASGPAMPAAVA